MTMNEPNTITFEQKLKAWRQRIKNEIEPTYPGCLPCEEFQATCYDIKCFYTIIPASNNI